MLLSLKEKVQKEFFFFKAARHSFAAEQEHEQHAVCSSCSQTVSAGSGITESLLHTSYHHGPNVLTELLVSVVFHFMYVLFVYLE